MRRQWFPPLPGQGEDGVEISDLLDTGFSNQQA